MRTLKWFTVLRRNGAAKTLPAAELVPGDVLVLREGDRLPGAPDLRQPDEVIRLQMANLVAFVLGFLAAAQP